MLKTILRWTWRAIAGLVGLGLALFLFVMLINCFDQDLAPTPAALQLPPNRLNPAQNLYMGIAGINAPEDITPTAFAQTMLEKYAKDVDALNHGAPMASIAGPDAPQYGGLAFHGSAIFLSPLTSSVWHKAPERADEIHQLLADNRLAYRHYLALHQYQGYYDTSPVASQIPYFFFVKTDLRNLFLADITLRMHNGTLDEQKAALTDLDADIQTWHAMLIGEGNLLSQMLAVAYLNADFLLLADMIADEKVDFESHEAIFEHMVTPFAYADWKTHNSMVREYALQTALWQTLPTGPAKESDSKDDKENKDDNTSSNWADRHMNSHFFQKNATLNGGTRIFEHVLAEADSDPATLLTAQASYREWANKQAPFQLNYIYNPIGKILLGVGMFSTNDYMLRAYDIAAMQHMVKLGFDIRHQHIATDQIPAFLASQADNAWHPVSRQAFAWNAATHELGLTPLAPTSKSRRTSIPVWNGGDVTGTKNPASH